MKNKLFFLGALALVLVLGLALVGCKTDEDDSLDGTYDGNVTLTASPSVPVPATLTIADNIWTVTLSADNSAFGGTFVVAGTAMTLYMTGVNDSVGNGTINGKTITGSITTPVSGTFTFTKK